MNKYLSLYLLPFDLSGRIVSSFSRSSSITDLRRFTGKGYIIIPISHEGATIRVEKHIGRKPHLILTWANTV